MWNTALSFGAAISLIQRTQFVKSLQRRRAAPIDASKTARPFSKKFSIEVQRPRNELNRLSFPVQMRWTVAKWVYFGATSGSKFVELRDQSIAYSLYSTVEEAKTQRSFCSYVSISTSFHLLFCPSSYCELSRWDSRRSLPV
jgi:hypothetical protein